MKKLIILILLFALIFTGDALGLYSLDELFAYFSFESIKAKQIGFQAFYEANKILTIGIYLGIYILATTFFIPIATVLTLLGGALFGVVGGTIIASFASTMGAAGSFLITRYFFRDVMEKRFKKHLDGVNKGIEREGSFYLFTLRLVPAFPFFAINSLMGLTRMNLLTFFIVSQIGMLPGTAVYVNAGTQLSELESLRGILSIELLGAFVLLGILPLISKKIIEYFKAKKIYKNFKRPKKFDYNIIAIGAGAAGLVTTYIGSAVKAKTLLIEKGKMGGDCLNTGCVPSKALIRTAKILHYIKKHKVFGISSAEARIDFSEAMERVQKIISKIEPHDSVERYTKLGVDCLQGEAKIISPWEVSVAGKTYSSRSLVVATGASPFIPPIPGIEKVKYLTSENIWDLRESPKKMVVLGGGPIGCELSQTFQRLGVEVSLVEMAPNIMIREDEEAANLVRSQLLEDGVEVLTGHKAIRFEEGHTLILEHEGNEKRIEFDQILVSIGRRANVKGFGLEDIGVAITERGTIGVDEYLRTNFPNIFAVGDVAGPYQFTHTAAHMAWFAAVNSLFGQFKKFKVDYSVVPWCTYTDPEVAHVGLNEKMAKEQGIEFEITKYGIDDLDRAIADSADKGFVKVLTAKGKDTILGVTIVGHHGGELLAEFVLAMKYGLGLNKILGTIHSYPTLSEANKYVAGEWKRAHKPEWLLPWIEKFHNWKRG